VEKNQKASAQADPKSKISRVYSGPMSGPPAKANATQAQASSMGTARRDPERADRREAGKNGAAPPARRQFRPLLPVRAEILGSEDEAPTPVVATLEAPAEATTLSVEEQLGQQLREELQSHFIAFQSTAETALRLGGVLLRAKECIPAGRFWAWFEEQAQGRCGQRTAQVYMRLAREAPRVREFQGSDAQNSAPLPVYKILKALSKPRDASPPAKSGDESPGRSSTQERTSTRGTADRDSQDSRADSRRTDGGDQAWRRDEATGSARSAKANRSARGDADTGAGKPASNGARHEPAGQDEPELTDENWLESFPIRAELTEPNKFDRAALQWRAAQRFLDRLPAALQATDEEKSRSRTASEAGKRFPLRLAAVRNTPPPEAWVPCEKCDGSGRSQAWSGACTVCDGDGFLLPLVGSDPSARPKNYIPAKD
jgi:hypothetical protein